MSEKTTAERAALAEPEWLTAENEEGVLKTIADGFTQFGYRQGTKECVAFHRGIRYALARAALASPASTEVPAEPRSRCGRRGRAT